MTTFYGLITYVCLICRLILFKILAQFVILGCTWILGLYQSNLFFKVVFIVLNSQQGTFLYIVHCLLNKEVDYFSLFSVQESAAAHSINNKNRLFFKVALNMSYYFLG